MKCPLHKHVIGRVIFVIGTLLILPLYVIEGFIEHFRKDIWPELKALQKGIVGYVKEGPVR